MGWTDDLKGALFGSEATSTPVWVDSVEDYRVPITDAQGKKTYRMPTQAERSRDGGAYTKKEAELKGERNYQRGLIEKQEAAAAERARLEGVERDRQFGVLQGQLQNQTTQITNAAQATQAQMAHQGAVLKANTEESAANRRQSADQFNANIALQTQQIQANNQLLKDRMGLEDKHFQQKMEYDKRMGRRAQVISSLSLVAQSLARL